MCPSSMSSITASSRGRICISKNQSGVWSSESASSSASSTAELGTQDSETFSSNQFVSFQITFGRCLGDFRRQLRARRLFIPVNTHQVIANILLVERRLRLADFVGIDRPKPGGIRCQYFVNQSDCAISVAPEFEFGVGDDDAAGAGIVARFCEQ